MPTRWLAWTLIAVSLAVAGAAGLGAWNRVGHPFPGFLPWMDATVGNLDQPSWEGTRGGLRYFDHIVSADGKPVHSSADIQAAAELARGKVAYQVERPGSTFTTEVAPSTFGVGQLLAAILPLWLMAGLLCALAIAVAWLKPNAPFTLAFALTCELAALIFFGDILTATTMTHAWVFAAGYYVLPAAVFHLGLTFPETRAIVSRAKWLVPGAYALQLAVFVAYLASLGMPHDPTIALHVMTEWMLALGFVGLIFNSLWTLMRSQSDLARTRARLLGVGMMGPLVTIVAETVAARSHMIVPLNVAAAPLLIFPVSMGLGLARNDLFEVDVFVRRGVRLVVTGAAVAVCYMVVEGAMLVVLGALDVAPLNAWVPLALAALVLVASERLRGGISWLVERVLYPRAQVLREALARARELFTTAYPAAEVAAVLLTELTSVLDVRDAALFGRRGDGYVLLRGSGRWLMLPPIAGDAPLVQGLLTRRRRIGFEELLEARHTRQLSSRGEGLLNSLESAGVRLATPLLFRQDLIGILLLGPKRGREPFNALDEEVISVMVASATLALEESRAYEKIQELNRDLERRVQERTRDLNEANEALRRATQFKSEFIRSVSHELRTPLNAILGFTDLVLQREAQLSPQSDSELKKARRNAQALLLLIEDLLDLGRIEAGRFQTKALQCDPGAVAREACAAVEPMARAKGLALSVEGLELPALVTDEGRVRQILVNLLGNAVKFTPSGSISVRGRALADAVEIEVHDSGPGIAPEMLESIFGEFVQLGAGAAQGTGLGLAISRKLARLLGGDVLASSTPGKGSCFTLRLPRAAEQRAVPVTPVSELPALRRTVLAVTEDPETIVRMRELLSQGGFEVAVAFDAAEAVARARQKLPFAVAVDGARLDEAEVRRALSDALGGSAPPSVLLPVPLERDALLNQLREIGDAAPAPR